MAHSNLKAAPDMIASGEDGYVVYLGPPGDVEVPIEDLCPDCGSPFIRTWTEVDDHTREVTSVTLLGIVHDDDCRNARPGERAKDYGLSGRRPMKRSRR